MQVWKSTCSCTLSLPAHQAAQVLWPSLLLQRRAAEEKWGHDFSQRRKVGWDQLLLYVGRTDAQHILPECTPFWHSWL